MVYYIYDFHVQYVEKLLPVPVELTGLQRGAPQSQANCLTDSVGIVSLLGPCREL